VHSGTFIGNITFSEKMVLRTIPQLLFFIIITTCI